ncbi:hypothetical protein MLD38_009902 [Melastoma candidum]|uniref:Uncharacterized protein n=1 Tax=Melastoma candidum TaxID=119954 RepID=A0ACB9S0A7_9MYRT|nr:hypothetical protein MLD38_009902 [Melastoma candidum]
MTSIGGSSSGLFWRRVRFSGLHVPRFDPPAEDVASCFRLCRLSVLALFVVAALVIPVVESGDAEALLALKALGDPLHVLPWPEGGDACRWRGVRDCLGGRVTKLVLEYLNLTGGWILRSWRGWIS